jgi:hypothetical protein
MKTMKQWNSMTTALLIWIVAVPLARAFYNPSTGRWLNRDPIAERGGANVAMFVANQPMRLHDARGLAGEPPAPDCTPCTYRGWEHRMSPDVKKADAWGAMEGRSDVDPGLDWGSMRLCCACGKSGDRYSTIAPVCSVKIWISAAKQPEDPVANAGETEKASSSIWAHEVRHANIFVGRIRKQDALYKSIAPLCVPHECGRARFAVLRLFNQAYQLEEDYERAALDCRDSSADCPESTAAEREMNSAFAAARSALSEFTSCMLSACGWRDFGLDLCGVGTCH